MGQGCPHLALALVVWTMGESRK